MAIFKPRAPIYLQPPRVDTPPPAPLPIPGFQPPPSRIFAPPFPQQFGLGFGSVHSRPPIVIPPAVARRVIPHVTYPDHPMRYGLGTGSARTARMAPIITTAQADSLVYYFTGAGADGGSQTAQDGCLGHFRSSTEAVRVSYTIATPIPNVQVLGASRYNAIEDTGGVGLGIGSIFSDGPNSLRYAAPGSDTPGSSVILTSGQTDRLIDGADPSKWVRVQRTSADQLAGGESIEFVDLFNDVFGLSNGTATGGNNYRAVMLRNDFSASITLLKLYVKPLISTNSVSSVTQLGAAGAGTITGAADSFCHFPWKGWARIETSVGVLREIVYYSSRTGQALSVPALGRGRLGTSAAAGAATDKIWAIPGIRVGFELATPLVNGSVQTIANETTSPNTASFVGTAWSTAITAATGISVGTLNYHQQGAIWIHRELPAGVSAISKSLNLIGVSYTSDGKAYNETLAGMYRIADSALARYEIFFGIGGAEPDLTGSPNETTPTLPYNSIYVVPPSTIVKVAVAFRNQYDLSSGSITTTTIESDSGSVEIVPGPITPSIISLTATAGGTFRLLAEYDYILDSNPGDVWRIYLKTGGTDPTTADLLASVTMTRPGTIGRVLLDYTTGSYANGTIVKVKVAVYRSSDGRLSALSETATGVADISVTSSPTGSIGQRKSFHQSQD
jgi:hypothetical protein